MADPTNPSKPRILVVDDGIDDLAVLREILEDEGFSVATASRGDRGLELARAFEPEVVLLDLQMPGLSGFEVLERLKADARTRDASIVVVSASSLEHDVVRALERGATDYVAKPYAIEILLARLRAVLRSRREKEAIWRLGEDLRAAQEELARARRGAALGAIAAGLAHEVNNPAAFVVADLHEVRELALELEDAGDADRAHALSALVDDALAGMNRIRDVVRDLSVFAAVFDRRSVPSTAAIDLVEIVRRRVERAPSEPRLQVQGLEGPAFVAPGLGSEDELDALIGLFLRHTLPIEHAAIALERTGKCVVLRVGRGALATIPPPSSRVDEPTSDWALTLTIARELAERFAGTIEQGPGGWSLSLPAARVT